MNQTNANAVGTWVDQILDQQKYNSPAAQASAYAPSNIALSKYWGKRETSFNLPVTGSLSISLAQHGTRTGLSVIDAPQHQVILNGVAIGASSCFAVKVCQWLDRVLPSDLKLRIDTYNTVPTAAGLASSASGFAALTLATNTLMGWQLPERQLSALARLGSGSASRSLWHGFAKWQVGELADGSDSIAFPLTQQWPQLRVGLLTISSQTKAVSSREGMARTIATSALYQQWPQQAQSNLATIEAAITDSDFQTMAATAEHNAMSMHATMAAAWPPLVYWQPESLIQMQKVWQLRQQGLPVYLTMDAGPNIKLLFEAQHQADVQAAFAEVQVISPFA
ncbi:MAG: diphosphomevalonate decarboxylase [Oceanospirillaceae bacterium]|jgi:diphosphomevalonate decarboxylase|nr:diphosphomevalonate decarboxylase [Oceanospirillaceae bacterium]MBT4443022.1 diphosphomevalonate decarboxylase [Oceanospirillaceae bacterium]MBT6077622.1 diphosphomevalonate decarboxylase [Oceanospirillaceae bacterium]MBT7330985.1 diphosphomevalonate decarboxylase [Oceanospirillaceae bacterium]